MKNKPQTKEFPDTVGSVDFFLKLLNTCYCCCSCACLFQ
uniref:Uncharacterized protein n=1 Tax=Anguilla anguilla TaxID=7936 RepID=A0A0E9R4H8_ANGAN